MNCLSGGHFVRNYRSVHHSPLCKKCQKQHHSLLHVDEQRMVESSRTNSITPVASHTSAADVFTVNSGTESVNTVVSVTAVPLKSSTLLMTCQVLVTDGTSVEARALLDNASSASFVSKHLDQNLRLLQSSRDIKLLVFNTISNPSHNLLQSISCRFAW